MRPEHNLVLTGFMGTGKTTVGHELALKLDMEFVDTDALIESRHGPIELIFDERGDEEFRSIERAVAAELGDRDGLVIATGGRMLLDPENFRALSRNGRIFCLVASPDEIHQRVMNDDSRKTRPLLQVDDPRQRIVELMAERADEYARFPQLTTDHVEPGAIADEIADLWARPSIDEIENRAGG
jgi:shikimate kinase